MVWDLVVCRFVLLYKVLYSADGIWIMKSRKYLAILVGVVFYGAQSIIAFADQPRSGDRSHTEHEERSDSGPSGGGSEDGGDTGGGGSNGGDDGDSENGGSSSVGSDGSHGTVWNNAGSSAGRVAGQDEVRKVVSAGKAVSLPLLLAFMSNTFPGEIVDIKLRATPDQYEYEVKYLANMVNLRSIRLDAKTLSKLY